MAASSGPPSGLSGMGESMAYSYGPSAMGTSMMPGPQQSMWGQQVAGSWLPPSTEYVINACGRDFPKMDGMFRKADPFLQVWAPAAASGGQRRLIFKSEVVKQNLNPQWRAFQISASDAGGESVPLTWEAWDWDEDGSNDYIGQFTATLEQVNSQPKFAFLNPDRKGAFGRKKKATVGEFHLLSVRKQQGQPKRVPSKIRLNLRGEKLVVKDIRTSDPYLVIWGQPLPSASGLPEDRDRPPTSSSSSSSGAAQRKYVVIGKTEVVDSNLNPVWQPIEIALDLTGGMDAKIAIECWDFDDDGTHDTMGMCFTTLRELTQPDPQIPLIENERKGGLGYKNSGYLRVVLAEEIPVPDYPEPPTLAYDFDVSCSKLARMDLNGKSDPFIQISTCLPKAPSTRVTIFKSEVIYKVLAGTFKRFQLSVADCGGLDNVLNFEVYDKDPKGQEIIGGFRTTLRELTMIKNNRHFLKNPKHMSKFSGIVTINSCTPAQTVQVSIPQAPQYKVNCAAHGITRHSSAFTIYAGSGTAGAPLFRSNTVPGKNPVYEAITLDTDKCGGVDGSLLFEFTNPNETGHKSATIGSCRTTLRELCLSSKNSARIPVINAKHAKKVPGYKASADLEIQLFEPVYGAGGPAGAAGGPGASQWYGGPPGGPPGGPSGWGPPPPWAGGPGGPGPSGWGPPPPWASGPGGPGGQSGWGQPPPWAYQQSGWGYGPQGGPGGGPPPGWGQGPPPTGGDASTWGQGPPPTGGPGGPPPGGPPAGGWGGPPGGQSGWGGPPPGAGGPPAGGWGGPPGGQSGWGGPPPGGPPSGGGPPGPGGWGPPPGGAGGPPAGGWGGPPGGQSGWGGPPAGGAGGPPPGGPPGGGWGPQPSWGGPPPPGGAGGPPAGGPGGWGPPPGGQGGWGGPPPGGEPPK